MEINTDKDKVSNQPPPGQIFSRTNVCALVITPSTTIRYLSAPKSWFSIPSFFLTFSMAVKRRPRTVMRTPWELPTEKTTTTTHHSLGGTISKQWNPQECTAWCKICHSATPSPLSRTCRTDGLLQTASNHALRGSWCRKKTPGKTKAALSRPAKTILEPI